MKSRSLSTVALAVVLSAFALADTTVEEKFSESGKVQLKYSLTSDGLLNGLYQEFYPNGKVRVWANFKNNELDGPYSLFFDNGKQQLLAAYKAGKLEGAYTEFSDKGQKQLTASYKAGKLEGALTRYNNIGQPVSIQLFKDGEPAYSRSLDQIKKDLAAILAPPAKKLDAEAAERDDALRKLKAFRYLAEVPYENLAIDDESNNLALAAAKICDKLGKLDHKPANPGLPEAEYKIAAKGAAGSNLSMGTKFIGQALDVWMFDSNPSNIGRLGHRRWGLNPTMGKVGFGKAGKVSAMYGVDMSGPAPNFDMVCFPARGLMPIEFFSPRHAWSVSVNPRKYKVSDAVKPSIYLVDAGLNKVGEPLKLDTSKVSTEQMGIPNCIIFRPEKISLAPGQRYLVEIDGLVPADGRPGPLKYLVEFMSLR